MKIPACLALIIITISLNAVAEPTATSTGVSANSSGVTSTTPTYKGTSSNYDLDCAQIRRNYFQEDPVPQVCAAMLPSCAPTGTSCQESILNCMNKLRQAVGLAIETTGTGGKDPGVAARACRQFDPICDCNLKEIVQSLDGICDIADANCETQHTSTCQLNVSACYAAYRSAAGL